MTAIAAVIASIMNRPAAKKQLEVVLVYPKTNQWQELVAPLVKICDEAVATKGQAVWNAEGADALSKLLTAMAKELDKRGQ